DEHRLVIGVGNPARRRELGDAAAARGARFLTLVHPTAYVAPNARLGAGCLVCPFAFIGVGAVLGDHVAVNTYASVGHDAQVGDCSVFPPYAVVNGAVVLGEEVFLGTHATVTPRLTVGRSAMIAAGAVPIRPGPGYPLARASFRSTTACSSAVSQRNSLADPSFQPAFSRRCLFWAFIASSLPGRPDRTPRDASGSAPSRSAGPSRSSSRRHHRSRSRPR